MNFAEKLKALRMTRRLTQETLAAAVGVKRATITQYEKGRIVPSHEVLLRLAGFFQVSLDELVNFGDTSTVQVDNHAWLPTAADARVHEHSLYRLISQKIVADLHRETNDDFILHNRLIVTNIIESIIILYMQEKEPAHMPLKLTYDHGTVDIDHIIHTYLGELIKLKKLTDLMQ
ncbi:MAG: helix-turn-helix transcriptional regulator [Bacillota bacterium]|nr:helix-turn-helix transcriptional regulator [Bacillota bacterium]